MRHSIACIEDQIDDSMLNQSRVSQDRRQLSGIVEFQRYSVSDKPAQNGFTTPDQSVQVCGFQLNSLAAAQRQQLADQGLASPGFRNELLFGPSSFLLTLAKQTSLAFDHLETLAARIADALAL